MRSHCLGMECGYCKRHCSAYKLLCLESSTARGKARLLDAFQKKKVPLEDMVKVAYFCTRCGYCSEVCPETAGAEEFILRLREEIVKAGLAPQKFSEKAVKIVQDKNPYNTRDASWTTEADRKDMKSKIAYFPGCNVQANKPDISLKTYHLLHELGINAQPVSEFCCGSGLMNTGYLDDWKSLSRDFLLSLKKSGIKQLILSCGGGCLRMFREEYPKYLGRTIPAVHITELLAENLPGLKGKWDPQKTRGRAIYHDSCVMGRVVKSTEAPRELIKASGLKLLEFDCAREETACCGGGGGLSALWFEEAGTLAQERVLEAERKKATYLVAGCPTCRMRFSAVEGRDEKLRIVDVVELLK